MKSHSSLVCLIAIIVILICGCMVQANASTFVKNTLPSVGVGSVAVSGNLVAVGIKEINSAFVLETPCSGGDSNVIPLLGGVSGEFGSAVAINGNVVAVGAPGYDGNRGAVYVVENPGTGWGQENGTILTASGVSEGARFGFPLAMSENLLVAGATFDNDKEGSVFVFEKSGVSGVQTWFQRARLFDLDGADGNQFGSSLSIRGNLLIVRKSISEAEKGVVYVYERNADNWVRIAALSAEENGHKGDRFGATCAISEDKAHIVVGAPGIKARGDDNRGAVYVFEKTGVSVVQVARLIGSDCSVGSGFGSTLALSGNMIIVGALSPTREFGSTYMFQKPENGWADMEAQPVRLDGQDFFGSYAFDGDNIVVGSFEEVFWGPFGNGQAVYVLNQLDENSYSLSVSLDGNGAGRITSSPSNIDCGDCCEKGFAKNGTVILSAQVEPGSAFDGWSDADCPGNGDCSTILNQDRTITATFNPDSDGDGISDIIENGGPFGGDANGDGTQDSMQGNVVTFRNIHGLWCTLSSEAGALEQVKALQDPSFGGCPKDKSFSEGFFGFKITGLTPGQKTVLKMILHTKDPDIGDYFKYGPTKENPVSHWYSFPFNGSTGANITQENNRTVIHLYLQDGGPGDDDLAEDGVIIDAGGPASLAASVSPSDGSSATGGGVGVGGGSGVGGGGGGGGCFISTIN